MTGKDKIRTEGIWNAMLHNEKNRALQQYRHVQRMSEHTGRNRIIKEWNLQGGDREEAPALRWKTYIRRATIDRDFIDGERQERELWKAKVKVRLKPQEFIRSKLHQ